MAHFVKLDAGILDSSLWPQVEPRTVFLTALLMARPVELTEPVEALQVRTLDRLGLTIPAGWYGLVEASGIGIAGRAGLTIDAGLSALERLASPDPDSRTPDFDGRRMVRIPGGWLVLNFMRYRERDYRAAERMRRYRTRNRVSRDAEPVTLRVTARNVTQAEAEAEAEVHMQKQTHTHARPEAALPPAAPAGRSAKREKVTAGRPEEVAADLWRDFLTLRRAKRAPLTERALAGIRRQADLAGKTLGEAIELCIERNWQSFDATWLRVEARGRASADAARRHTFRASDYGEGGAI